MYTKKTAAFTSLSKEVHPFFYGVLLCLFALSIFSLSSPSWAKTKGTPEDQKSAAILVYHRIGEDAAPATSIRFEQFAAHIEELLTGPYHILPLPEIIQALEEGRTLPDHSVALTFDGGYRSAYDKAFPLLLKKDIPFTVFVAPSLLKGASPQFINRKELTRLARHEQVTIGIHPAIYTRLSGSPESEIKRQINNAVALYREIFDTPPKLFAYPFGEYSQTYRNLVEAAGFKAALGQHSGAAYHGEDFFALPRFALTENYGSLARFRLIANALPLPVSNITPHDPRLTSRKPAIGFTVAPSLADNVEQIACFSSQPLKKEFIGSGRVELRPENPYEGDRVRINCTMPAATDEPPSALPDTAESQRRWRWFGLLLTFSPEA